MKTIKVLGPGCKKCKQLEMNVQEAVKSLTGEFRIEKIEDYQQMAQYGILSTPGLVIDEKLITSGKVQTVSELIEILK